MAGKKNQNNRLTRLRRSIIDRLREELEFIDVKIMSFVLSIVLMISVIAATVAWFLIDSPVQVSGLNLTTGSIGDIEVSLTRENWTNVLEYYNNLEDGHGETTEAEIAISMPAFENIYDKDGNKVETADSGIMAPGTYGEFTFYVKSANPVFGKCQINIAKVLETVTGAEDRMEEVNELLKGHILCFAKVEGSDTYTYVSEENPVEVEFTFDGDECEPEEVQVYWVWPYEYEDLAADVLEIGSIAVGTADAPVKLFALPELADMTKKLDISTGNEAVEGYFLACSQVFEWERYSETVDKFADADNKTREEMLSDWYDYADTLVGTCVENVVFHIGVKGVVE